MRPSFLPLLTVLSRLLYGEQAARVGMVLTDQGGPVPNLTSYDVRTREGSPLKASNAPDHPLIKELLQDALFLQTNGARVSVLSPPHFELPDQIQEPDVPVDIHDDTRTFEFTFDARLHFARMSDLDLVTFIRKTGPDPAGNGRLGRHARLAGVRRAPNLRHPHGVRGRAGLSLAAGRAVPAAAHPPEQKHRVAPARRDQHGPARRARHGRPG